VLRLDLIVHEIILWRVLTEKISSISTVAWHVFFLIKWSSTSCFGYCTAHKDRKNDAVDLLHNHDFTMLSCQQWRAEVWWCLGRLLDCMPPYQILILSSGVWWSLLLDYAVCDVTIWRDIHICKPTFWWSLLTQHAYYSSRTLLTHCCTTRHCNEHKLISVLQVRRPE